MKNIYLIALISLMFLCQCKDIDSTYFEGQVKTLHVTDIASQSATLNGEVKISQSHTYSKEKINIIQKSFIVNGSPLGSPIEYTEDTSTGEGTFNLAISKLSPNTEYTIQAYVDIKWTYTDRKRFFGNTIKFKTKDN